MVNFQFNGSFYRKAMEWFRNLKKNTCSWIQKLHHQLWTSGWCIHLRCQESAWSPNNETVVRLCKWRDPSPRNKVHKTIRIHNYVFWSIDFMMLNRGFLIPSSAFKSWREHQWYQNSNENKGTLAFISKIPLLHFSSVLLALIQKPLWNLNWMFREQSELGMRRILH